jgi:outer membrane protein
MLIAIFALMLIATGVPAVQAANISVGGGIAAVPDYIGSEDYTAAPLPYFTVDWDNHMNVHLVGNKLRSNLVPHPVFKAGVVGEFISERDDVENNRVDDMKKVDAALMLGGFVGFAYQGWNGRIEYMADATDSNDGAIGRLAVGWGTALGDTMRLNLEGYTTYGDDDFMNTYFGVGGKDSRRSGLDKYDADSGIYNVGLNVTHVWNFAGAWRLISIAGVSQLVGDADNSSPVVDQGSETQGVLGVMVTYSF